MKTIRTGRVTRIVWVSLMLAPVGAVVEAGQPVNTAFSYQGQLKWNSVAVSDTCRFRFTLWDAPVGGTQIGSPVNFDGSAGNPPVTVVNGLFTVLLDFGTAAFDGSARWLQIEVAHPTGGPLTALSPRQSLTPVPFALHAVRAATIGGPSSSGPIRGTWQLRSGIMLPNFDANLEVTGMVLDDGGMGRVFFRDLLTGTNDCVRILYLFYNNDTLLIDFVRERSLRLHPERTNIFPTVVIDGDFLGLADGAGNIALFSREDALPADVSCGALQVVELFTNIPVPSFFSGLVLFNGDLVYNSTNNQIEVFDLATDAIIAPLAPTNSRLIQTTQSVAIPPHFWHHCACGGSPDISRSNLTTVFDTIHTANDLSRQITIRAAAFVPTTNRLWLHGFGQANGGRFVFLIVDSNAEPDVLDQAIDFNREVRGLAFDGTDLWGFVTMATRSVARINPGTGRVVETFEVPDEDVATWVGIAFEGDHMYLLGITNTNSTGPVLYRVVRP